MKQEHIDTVAATLAAAIIAREEKAPGIQKAVEIFESLRRALANPAGSTKSLNPPV